jgi:ankyrin repeat protein
MPSEALLLFLQTHGFKSIDTKNPAGNYPIHQAIILKQKALIEELIALKVDLNKKNKTEQSILDLAFKLDEQEIFNHLIEHTNTYITLACTSPNAQLRNAAYHVVYEIAARLHADFFDILKHCNPQIMHIGQQFHLAMQALNHGLIDASELSKRELVIARSYPYRIALMNLVDFEKSTYSKADDKLNQTQIAKACHWYNAGFATSGEINKNWVNLQFLSSRHFAPLKLQIFPCLTQLGNLRLSNVDAYGKDEQIIKLLKELTGNDEAKEQILAKLCLDYCRFGIRITNDLLEALGLNSFTSKIPSKLQKLHAFLHLLTVEEIHRRLYPGVIEHKIYQDALPMGIGVAIGLKLMEKGHIRLEEFFSKDHPYSGPFTHDQIMGKEGLVLFHQKMQALLELCCSNLQNQFYTPAIFFQGLLNDCFGKITQQNANMPNVTSFIKQFTLTRCIHHAIQNNYSVAFIQNLVQAGASLDVHDDFGQTPLHLTVEKDRVDLARLFLDMGALTTLKNDQNQTPLNLAKQKKHELMISLLNHNEEDKWLNRNHFFQTPLHEALLNRRVTDKYILKLIASRFVAIDALDGMGNTALHYAVMTKKTEIVIALLANNADVHIKNKDHNSALDLSCSDKISRLLERQMTRHKLSPIDTSRFLDINKNGQNRLHQAIIEANFSEMRVLINQHFDLDAQDVHGYTALHYAVKAHLLDYAIYLINAGACLDIRANDLTTPMDIAEKQEDSMMINLLKFMA